MSNMTLRCWQSKFHDIIKKKFEQGETNFSLLAAPGSGKTIAVATKIRIMFEQEKIDYVICISPSTNITNTTKDLMESVLGRSFDSVCSVGVCLTYQKLFHLSKAYFIELKSKRVLLFLDEVHRTAKEYNKWAHKIEELVIPIADYIIVATGTPTRGDGRPLSCVSYNQDGKIVSGYEYTMSQAVSDGVCRPPVVHLIDSEEISIVSNKNSKKLFLSINESLTHIKYADILNNHDFIFAMLNLTFNKLSMVKRVNPTAACLVIAIDTKHARFIEMIIRNNFNYKVAVVYFDKSDSTEIIKRFNASDDDVLIAVKMVSEGVDINRLQVACYLSNIRTDSYIRQVLGRIQRVRSQDMDKYCYFFTPSHSDILNVIDTVTEFVPDAHVIKINIKSSKKNDNKKANVTADMLSTGNDLNAGNDDKKSKASPLIIQVGTVKYHENEILKISEKIKEDIINFYEKSDELTHHLT